MENILRIVFDNDYEILEKMESEFKCPCCKEKFMGGLISLGRKEIQDIIDKDGKAEAVCHYCGNSYEFDLTELNKILKEAK